MLGLRRSRIQDKALMDVTGFLLLVWITSTQPQHYPKVYEFPDRTSCARAQLVFLETGTQGMAICAEVATSVKREAR